MIFYTPCNRYEADMSINAPYFATTKLQIPDSGVSAVPVINMRSYVDTTLCMQPSTPPTSRYRSCCFRSAIGASRSISSDPNVNIKHNVHPNLVPQLHILASSCRSSLGKIGLVSSCRGHSPQCPPCFTCKFYCNQLHLADLVCMAFIFTRP
jgi:hypothetical protein